MNRENYQKKLDTLLAKISETQKEYKLMLHACCAPCSSYCLEYLSEYFEITVLFYNPNINTEEEYIKRADELKRFITECVSDGLFKHNVDYIDMDYNPDEFYQAVKGYEHYPEGHERCFICYEQRIEMAAKIADKYDYDYFCTTLSLSPLKNSEVINRIGNELAKVYNAKWLPSDFKKKNGFKRSIELSKEHNLYRQNYCGCIFSKKKENPFSDCIL